MAASWFPQWTQKTEGVIAPDERLPWPQTIALGLQHVVAMFGATVLAPLLMGFSSVGLFTGALMLRRRLQRERLGAKPRWWMVEHYTAMLGNGIATHIAFLGIGLPRLLPSVDGTVLHYLSWFGPLAMAIVAKLVLDRRWKPRPARAPSGAPRPQHA